jgi:DNA-binding LytR/AlgR family response regulator
VDDEPLARCGLERYIRDIPQLQLTASCSNVTEFLGELKKQPVDLLLLDIQMPKITGMDLLRSVRNLPVSIITSAYSDFALQSYEFEVIDYLVKPISLPRFLKAIDKAAYFIDVKRRPAVKPADFIFIKCNNKYERLDFNEILFVESLQNYVAIQTYSKKLVCHLTLKSIENQLPISCFVRINKSTIVALRQIDHIAGNGKVCIGEHTFSVSRLNKHAILQKILTNRNTRQTGTE